METISKNIDYSFQSADEWLSVLHLTSASNPPGVLPELWETFRHSDFCINVVSPLSHAASMFAPMFTIGGAIISYMQMQALNAKLADIDAKLTRVAADVAEILKLVRELPGIQTDTNDQTVRRTIFNKLLADRRYVVETVLPPLLDGDKINPKKIPREAKGRIRKKAENIITAMYELDNWSVASDPSRTSHLTLAYVNSSMAYAYQSYLMLSKLCGGDAKEDNASRSATVRNIGRNRELLLSMEARLQAAEMGELHPIDAIPNIMCLGLIDYPHGKYGKDWLFLERSGTAKDGYKYDLLHLPRHTTNEHYAEYKKYYTAPQAPKLFPEFYAYNEQQSFVLYLNMWRERSAEHVRLIRERINGSAAAVQNKYSGGLKSVSDVKIAADALVHSALPE